MNLSEIHKVYFLGIGGIGMSAIARWFNANGVAVSGYDKTQTTLTQALVSEGIGVHYSDSTALIPEAFHRVQDDVLVVYTPAIPKDSVQLNYLQSLGHRLFKRSEVLGLITNNYFTIAVAGTHGKTTTSSIVSHLLKSSGRNVMAFVGGISQNYQSNLLVNEVDSDEKPIVVVEADEFDRSFHHLKPNVVVLTTVDPDHLDIYHDAQEFNQGFREFLTKISVGGTLIVNECVSPDIYQELGVKVLTYGTQPGNDVRLMIDSSTANLEKFSLSTGDSYELGISGIHNVHNAVGALISAQLVDLTPVQIQQGLASFRGVKRRFEYIVNRPDVVYIDDYAHHPSELKSLLDSVQEIYPNKKITAVFQPHLFSRTRDFMDGFVEQLSRIDDLILLDIYPARELPIEGIDSQVLLDQLRAPQQMRCPMEEVVATLSKKELEVVLTIGAGNIDLLIQPIRDLLELNQAIV